MDYCRSNEVTLRYLKFLSLDGGFKLFWVDHTFSNGLLSGPNWKYTLIISIIFSLNINYAMENIFRYLLHSDQCPCFKVLKKLVLFQISNWHLSFPACQATAWKTWDGKGRGKFLLTLLSSPSSLSLMGKEERWRRPLPSLELLCSFSN